MKSKFKVNETLKKYGALLIPIELGQFLPPPKTKIKVVSSRTGQEYDGKVHSVHRRIDGLTNLKNDDGFEVGDEITIEYDSELQVFIV